MVLYEQDHRSFKARALGSSPSRLTSNNLCSRSREVVSLREQEPSESVVWTIES